MKILFENQITAQKDDIQRLWAAHIIRISSELTFIFIKGFFSRCSFNQHSYYEDNFFKSDPPRFYNT